jgi:hypothetical protein
MKEQTATNPHSEWTPGMFADVYWRGSVIAVVGKSHVCLVSEHGRPTDDDVTSARQAFNMESATETNGARSRHLWL